MYEKYKALRDESGVTDTEVARATGISRSAFTDWRKGVFTPKQGRLEKLADYFGVPVSYFFDDKPAHIFTKDVKELISEAEKANDEDLRVVLALIKHLNSIRERGTHAESN